MLPKLGYNLLQMLDLRGRVLLKAGSIKGRTRGIFEGFLAEIAHQRAACIEVGLVDNVVEGAPCKVTEQYCLTVCPLVHAADEVG